MDHRPPGSSLHRISQARILECVAISFSKGIFLIKDLNPGVLHWRRILYHLSHQKKIPKTLIYMSIYIHIQVHVLEIISLCPISSTLIYFNRVFSCLPPFYTFVSPSMWKFQLLAFVKCYKTSKIYSQLICPHFLFKSKFTKRVLSYATKDCECTNSVFISHFHYCFIFLPCQFNYNFNLKYNWLFLLQVAFNFTYFLSSQSYWFNFSTMCNINKLPVRKLYKMMPCEMCQSFLNPFHPNSLKSHPYNSAGIFDQRSRAGVL